MDKFEKGVREVLSQYSHYTFDQVGLDDSLEKYFDSFMVGRMAREFGRKFRLVSVTALTNQLLVELKTVRALVKSITSYYSES